MGGVSSDTENVEGQFKVTGCHPRSNGLSLLYGPETWWVESFSDANFLKVSSRSSGSPKVQCPGFIIVVWT